ncbi:MAG: type II secretion system protein [Rickettsiales bacterium]
MRARQYGFSLVELSIVLAIIGLLTGGILAGRHMIRSAKLNSVVTEYNGHRNALNVFMDRYYSLPGDMPDAESHWGTAINCPGTSAQPSTDERTCDGNGSGYIIFNETANSNEVFRAWQHLANAGLVEGKYTGVVGPGHALFHSVPGENSPRSKFGNAGWNIRWLAGTADGNYTGDTRIFSGIYRNVLHFGGASNTELAMDPIITPEEAYEIDRKADDGKPAQGDVVVMYWGPCTDAADEDDSTSDYDRAVTSESCSLVFRNLY